VKELFFDPPAADMSYTIGDPALTGAAFNFIQVPDCQDDVIIMDNGHPLVILNPAEQDFTID